MTISTLSAHYSKRVVITGGAGFIGLATADALNKAGHTVTILDRPDRLQRAQSYLSKHTCVSWDFRSQLDVSELPFDDADVLIHLACTTLPATSMHSLSYDAASNIIGSLKTMETALKKGVKKIIFSSSGGTIYGIPSYLPIPESHQTLPISGYGVSKLAIERYMSLIAQQNDITAISLRIGNPYGPMQYQGAGVGAIARYLIAIHQRQSIPVWGDGSVVRDYLYIDDLSEAFTIAVNSENLTSGEYNIGSGVGYSLNDVISLISKTSAERARIEFGTARSFDPPAIVLDSRKFQTFGWKPKISLEIGIREMWAALSPPVSCMVSNV